jgi:hypothetical protein
MKKYEGALASSELPCTVPSSANTVSTITTVQPTTIPQDILCKSGYSGMPKYTCINGVFNIASGSCTQITSCNVSDCASENFPGYGAVTDVTCINLKSIIGDTVNINTTGIYHNKLSGYYYPQVISGGPYYSLKWRCKSDGTMDIDIEKGCIYWTTYHYYIHGDATNTHYITNDGINWDFIPNIGYRYCCSGLFKYENQCPPWLF